ncbi:MAG: PPC domain-containing protein, partial [Planctomycetes bacterium]|nr:PPC domain-containing protein [Planctomycetota bacterium]
MATTACVLRYRLGWLLGLVAWALLGSLSLAASPELANVTPHGGQRGTELVLNFNGSRLSDAREILFYDPGFTVSNLKAVNDNQVQATVKMAADCRLGEHALRVRTATGISELRTFYVGALPNLDEKEPNNDFTAPQKIPLNVTVNGVVTSEDVDYFSFEAKKGQRVSAEIEGMRLGNTQFDPYIAILDRKRFELAAMDDSPLLGQDAAVSVLIPEDGTYVVQVRESAYGGNGNCAYRLHVGTFPRPTAVFPPGGKIGEEVEVRFLGDPGGEIHQRVKLPAPVPPGKFGLFAQDAGGISPSAVPFRLSEFGNVIEAEPNNTPQQGTPCVLPAALNGTISQPGDVDYFRFKARKGETYDVQCYARRLGSPLDSVMTIAVLGGGAIASNDDTNGPDSYIRFTAPEDKEYVVSITDHLGQGGPTYVYRVEFTPVRPQLSLSIPKLGVFSQERQTIAVPRGNRYATLINAARADFGGELVLAGAGLPSGITLHMENMAANQDTVPVVFEADAKAAVAGGLAQLTAHHFDPAQKISGGFRQTAELIIGDPGNSVYWRTEVDRLAVAVTEEAPFQVRLVEPKVPLVQNGSMNLKVVAERKPGFKAPINVQMVFNPPGVSSASSATIPEGKNDTDLTINAAGNAEARKWKIA